jgi:murein L,D-transpeptidase YcbB/YkuD
LALKETRIHTLVKHQEFPCKEALLCGSAELSRFYTRRGFQPAWSTNTGPVPEAKSIIEAIHGADLEGLRPEDYHLASIETLLAEAQAAADQLDPETLAALDLLLTNTFFLYASHSSTGRVHPETIHSEWFIKGEKANFVEILETALKEDKIEDAMENLRPQNKRYDAMKPYLSQYQNIMKLGGWPKVPHGSLMHKGHRGTRVAVLRSRLSLSGDLDESTESNPDLFSEALEGAVKRFQKRHGLKIDGMVGPETLAALNVTVEERIRQIKLNMERWRWLPRDFGSRYVLVPILDWRSSKTTKHSCQCQGLWARNLDPLRFLPEK